METNLLVGQRLDVAERLAEPEIWLLGVGLEWQGSNYALRILYAGLETQLQIHDQEDFH